MYDIKAAKAIIGMLRDLDVKVATCCSGCRETAIRKWDSIEMVLDNDRFNEYEAWQREANQAIRELALLKAGHSLSNDERIELNNAKRESKMLRSEVDLLSRELTKACDLLVEITRKNAESNTVIGSIREALLSVSDIPF